MQRHNFVIIVLLISARMCILRRRCCVSIFQNRAKYSGSRGLLLKWIGKTHPLLSVIWSSHASFLIWGSNTIHTTIL